MRRWHRVNISSIAVGLVCAGALVVSRSHVPSEVIASSATRTPEPIERAWHLPGAATFQRHVDSQSNGSRCGPAAVANTYLSLGEAARTECKVLAGTWSCWTGVCIMGLTLDELAKVAQSHPAGKLRASSGSGCSTLQIPSTAIEAGAAVDRVISRMSPFGPISEVAARLVEASLLGREGLDLLRFSFF